MLSVVALPSLAQAPARLPRVGFLILGYRGKPDHWEVQWAPLRKRGYVDGKTVTYLQVFADTQASRMEALARELAAMKPDVVVTEGAGGVRAARAHMPGVPIIMVGGDPVVSGLADSYARPGRNMTAISTGVSPGAKPVEFLRQLVPATKRAVLLHDNNRPDSVDALIVGARSLGIELRAIPIESAAAIERAFETLKRTRPDGLLIVTQVGDETRALPGLALKSGIPAIYNDARFVERGGLMSYGAAPARGEVVTELVADYIDKILRGANAGELPVLRTTEFRLVINRTTAKSLGLVFPPELALRADRIID